MIPVTHLSVLNVQLKVVLRSLNSHFVEGKLIHFVCATVVRNNCKVLQPAVCFGTKVSLNDLPFIRRVRRGTLSTKVQTKSMKSPTPRVAHESRLM